MSLRDLIESNLSNEGRDELSYVAGLVQDSGLSDAQIGTLVHRIAELRAMHLHPDEVASGTRYVEQRVQLVNSESQGEIDDIIVRGDKYYIRDYKPINLADFEETPEGHQWAEFMSGRLGEDFREQIAGGRNPFAQDMPKDIRGSLRAFLKSENSEHQKQLSSYKEAFVAAHSDAKPDHVYANVRPYFVYR